MLKPVIGETSWDRVEHEPYAMYFRLLPNSEMYPSLIRVSNV